MSTSPGITPTMAIPTSGPAFKAADPYTSLTTDQRGIDRPQEGVPDIGAYEACAPLRIPNEITCQILVNAPPPNTVPLTVEVVPVAGGTTSPAPGTTQEVVGSVVIVTATPNPGYYFSSWTSTDLPLYETDASIGLAMNSAHTLEANFLPCGCATDVTNSIAVTRGPMVLNPVTRDYVQTVTVKNNSAKTLTGPITLVLQDLSLTALLINATGTTTFATPLGSPYITTDTNLAPSGSVSFALQFQNMGNVPITDTTRVLAGPGAR